MESVSVQEHLCQKSGRKATQALHKILSTNQKIPVHVIKNVSHDLVQAILWRQTLVKLDTDQSLHGRSLTCAHKLKHQNYQNILPTVLRSYWDNKPIGFLIANSAPMNVA